MDPSQIVDRFFREVWNQRRFAVLDEIVDPGCVTHQVRSAPGAQDSGDKCSVHARCTVGTETSASGFSWNFTDVCVRQNVVLCGDRPHLVAEKGVALRLSPS